MPLQYRFCYAVYTVYRIVYVQLYTRYVPYYTRIMYLYIVYGLWRGHIFMETFFLWSNTLANINVSIYVDTGWPYRLQSTHNKMIFMIPSNIQPFIQYRVSRQFLVLHENKCQAFIESKNQFVNFGRDFHIALKHLVASRFVFHSDFSVFFFLSFRSFHSIPFILDKNSSVNGIGIFFTFNHKSIERWQCVVKLQNELQIPTKKFEKYLSLLDVWLTQFSSQVSGRPLKYIYIDRTHWYVLFFVFLFAISLTKHLPTSVQRTPIYILTISIHLEVVSDKNVYKKRKKGIERYGAQNTMSYT